MAIQLISTTKPIGGVCTVTVQDTGNQVGTDETGQPIYKTYSVRHNVNLSASDLKARIEKQILADQEADESISSIKTAIKTAVESIDTSKLSAVLKEMIRIARQKILIIANKGALWESSKHLLQPVDGWELTDRGEVMIWRRNDSQ